MGRKVTDLGLLRDPKGKDFRTIDICASTDAELEAAISEAKSKGWSEVPFMRGHDPANGAPKAWMQKAAVEN